jgi:hypothetical protein
MLQIGRMRVLDEVIGLFNSSNPGFLKFFEVGTTFISQNSSADNLALVPFESKFIIFSIF